MIERKSMIYCWTESCKWHTRGDGCKYKGKPAVRIACTGYAPRKPRKGGGRK